MIIRQFFQKPSIQSLMSSQYRLLSNSSRVLAGGKFREKKGQAADGYSYGPLTDLPDWTYVDDGNNVAMTKRQIKRQIKRVKMGADISRLLKEIDEQKTSSEYGKLEEQHRDY